MNKNEKKAVILIVDDEKSLRDSMQMLLSDNYEVIFASRGLEAIEKVKQFFPDLVLLDIRLPEIDGLEVLRRIKDIDPDLDVVMVTAMNTVQYAVDAMKAGAYDYITKPFDVGTISSLISKILEQKKLRNQNIFLKEEVDKRYRFEKMVGISPEMLELFSVISQISENDSTILIYGESGTGKELVARAIHNLSKRSNNLFVPVNCAAIPENLLESELFGHERGSFTGAVEKKLGKFEIADGGTLFLDEVSSLPLAMQAKLLRALQEKEIERVGGQHPIPVDARIVSATNINLLEAVKKNEFRNDLYYRLNVIPINISPLRERREDIPVLLKHFLDFYNVEFGKKIKGFSVDCEDALISYDWPGNVRELQNLIERLVVLSKDDVILEEKLPLEIRQAGGDGFIEIDPGLDTMNLRLASMKFESEFIKKALEKVGGRKNKAAELLGIHRNTLIQIEKKLKKQN